MRVVKLCSGPGNGIDTACLMTASNMLIGKPEAGDQNDCVCPVIRDFIIPSNDAMPDELRHELYGPLVWEILGTRVVDYDTVRQRAYFAVDYCMRVVVPLHLDNIQEQADAATLRNLKPIIDKATAIKAAAVARSLRSSIYSSVYFTRNAIESLLVGQITTTMTNCAEAIKCSQNWHLCPDIIRAMAAIGDKRPVETVISVEELERRLA